MTGLFNAFSRRVFLSLGGHIVPTPFSPGWYFTVRDEGLFIIIYFYPISPSVSTRHHSVYFNCLARPLGSKKENEGGEGGICSVRTNLLLAAYMHVPSGGFTRPLTSTQATGVTKMVESVSEQVVSGGFLGQGSQMVPLS